MITNLHAEVAPGVHRIEHSFTNVYLLEDGDRLTLVDAGVPTAWEPLHAALRGIGRALDDIQALVLTHAHFDHVGIAERIRSLLGIRVYVHENDVPLTQHPWRYDHERRRTRYLATQVRALPMVAALIRNRAWLAPPIKDVVRPLRIATWSSRETPSSRWTPTTLKTPQPTSSIPACVRHGGASARRCQARTVRYIAVATNAQVATWKNPSARTFASKPATVVIGSSPVPVSM